MGLSMFIVDLDKIMGEELGFSLGNLKGTQGLTNKVVSCRLYN